MAAHGPAIDGVGRQRAQRAQQLGRLVAHVVGLEGHRRLHPDQAQELEHVVLKHIADDPGRLVVRAALLDPQALGGGDLDVVDVLAVPEWLEDPVGEAEDQQVLHGLFAQVVVDPVDLRLGEDCRDRLVERAGARQVAPERLFDHDPAPAVARLARHAGCVEAAHDSAEEARWGRQVIQPIAAGAALGIDVVEPLAQPRVASRVAEVAGEIEQVLCEVAPALRVAIRLQFLPKARVVPWVDRIADNRERLGQHTLRGQTNERWH